MFLLPLQPGRLGHEVFQPIAMVEPISVFWSDNAGGYRVFHADISSIFFFLFSFYPAVSPINFVRLIETSLWLLPNVISEAL